jgi:mono/diheme cytochrome c family protein
MMSSSFSRCAGRRLRSALIGGPSGWCVLSVAALAVTFAASVPLTVHARQPRTVRDGVFTTAQAGRGQTLFQDKCVSCHGTSLSGDVGPPLTGADFVSDFDKLPLSDLVSKIQNTMPNDNPGQLTREQSTDLTAYLLSVNKFPAGARELSAEEEAVKQIAWPVTAPPAPAATATTAAAMAGTRPFGNLAQVMRGILFPSSNLIFNAQNQDPGEQKIGWAPGKTAFSWVDWGAGIYSGWELIDYAAVTLAESAPLLLTPGRRCENGKPVPIDRPDWIKFTNGLVDAARIAYKASQSRNQEAVIAATDQVSDSCLNCHEVYRDKPGGTAADPSNKGARCTP